MVRPRTPTEYELSHTKVCKKCRKRKPLSEFLLAKTTKDRHEGTCRDCRYGRPPTKPKEQPKPVLPAGEPKKYPRLRPVVGMITTIMRARCPQCGDVYNCDVRVPKNRTGVFQTNCPHCSQVQLVAIGGAQ